MVFDQVETATGVERIELLEVPIVVQYIAGIVTGTRVIVRYCWVVEKSWHSRKFADSLQGMITMLLSLPAALIVVKL